MAKVKITQVRSAIRRKGNQKATLVALGLRGINKSVEQELTDNIKGMINVVKHLIKVEDINE